MKKFILGLNAIILACATLLVSCTKEKVVQIKESTTIQDIVKVAKEGAIVHNEAMGYILNALSTEQNAEKLFDELETITTNFIMSHSFFNNYNESALKTIKTYYNKVRFAKTNRTNLWFDEDAHLFSKTQKDWLTLVYNALKYNDDIIQIANEWDEIVELVLKEGSYEDQYIVIIAVEIGKESIDYWYNHAAEWENLNPDNFSKGWFNWNDCAGDDLAGGVGGAVGGAVLGPGAAAGFVGGAIACSAGNAVKQVWNHLF